MAAGTERALTNAWQGALAATPWCVCVPLDGSAYAEGALPDIAAIAGQRRVELVLQHIDQTGAASDVTGYLDLIAAWASGHVCAVSCRVTQWPAGRSRNCSPTSTTSTSTSWC